MSDPNAGRYDNLHGDEHLPPDMTEEEEKELEDAKEWLARAIVRDCMMGVYGFDWLWADEQYEELARDVQAACAENFDGHVMDFAHFGFQCEEAIMTQAAIFARGYIEKGNSYTGTTEEADRLEWLAEHDEDRRRQIKEWLK